MCDPILGVLSAGLSAAGALSDHQAQRAAAKERQRVLQARAAADRRAAAERYAQNLSALSRQKAARSLQIAQQREKALKGRERARVAASERGLAYDPIAREIEGSAAEFVAQSRGDHADSASATLNANHSEQQALQGRLDQLSPVREASAIGLAEELVGVARRFSTRG